MPTKTGEKIRIIVLGTGSDAELARAVAKSDADVALAAKFTKTVTHLVVDDTVKPTEARVKKAEEEGVPVLAVAEFQDLLTAGEEDETEAPEPEAVDEPADEPEPEAAPVAEPEPEPVAEQTAEPEPVAEAEPEPEPEPAVPSQAEAPEAETQDEQKDEAKAEPTADEAVKPSPKPGIMARIKSIFTGAGK